MKNTHALKITSRQSGFTLVEMLLVLVILAILAGIVIPGIANRGEEARRVAARADVASLVTALNMFELDTGSYPTASQGLQALLQKPGSVNNWKGPYVAKTKLPIDPWTQPYVYVIPGKHNPTTFDIYSKGKDALTPIGNWDN